jgi:hypothetical protein
LGHPTGASKSQVAPLVLEVLLDDEVLLDEDVLLDDVAPDELPEAVPLDEDVSVRVPSPPSPPAPA